MQAMENKWTRLGVLILFSGFRSFRVHHFKGVCLVLNNVERLFSLLASLGLLVFFSNLSLSLITTGLSLAREEGCFPPSFAGRAQSM